MKSFLIALILIASFVLCQSPPPTEANPVESKDTIEDRVRVLEVRMRETQQAMKAHVDELHDRLKKLEDNSTPAKETAKEIDPELIDGFPPRAYEDE